MSVQISVVIPTYRRDGLLRICLNRLLAQSLDRSQYEIIVCDDGPSDSTWHLVASLENDAGPLLRYIPITATQGPAAARNRGWEAARGSIIAFTDDDCQPDSNWLSEGLAAIATADAVTGRTIVPLPERPTDHELDTAGLATAEFITANCFVRRAALSTVGGFDERFTAAWRENSDLHFSLLERRFRIVRASEAIVTHPVRKAPWGVSVKSQRKGIFDPLLRVKHPALYAERIAPFPRLYFFVVAAIAMALGGLALQRVDVVTAGVALWFVATLVFTWRRLRRTSLSPSHIAEMLFTSALIPPLSLYWWIAGIARYGWPTRPVSGNSEVVGVTTPQRAL